MVTKEHDTDPSNLKPTIEDVISNLVGSLARIEAQLTAYDYNTTPMWAERIFDSLLNVVSRVEVLESKVRHIEAVCALRHIDDDESVCKFRKQ
jgi:hypothetical protein